MEPLSLATAAVGLLVPYFKQGVGKFAERAGETVAEAAVPKVGALYELLRAKLTPDKYQNALLEGLRAEPDNSGRQEILRAELARVVAQDQQLASELERLVVEAEQIGGVRITASDAGVVAGQDVSQLGQYVAGRNMTIGDPSRER